MATVYSSRIDMWLLAVLASALAVSIYASAVVLAGSPAAWWALLLTAGIGIGLPLWLLMGTRYTLEQQQLIVRSGPFKWIIPIAQITSITPTRNPSSSPSLSLDRLRIEYGRGNSIMISPRNKETFLGDIGVLRSENH